jgi:small subunit ribosomal protein S16
MGRKKAPHYRVVVADGDSPRDGRFVETIGYYKPLSTPARVVVDLERADYWLGKGAEPSATVKSLLNKARRGGDATVAVGEVDAAAEKARRAEDLARRRQAEAQAGAQAAGESVESS